MDTKAAHTVRRPNLVTIPLRWGGHSVRIVSLATPGRPNLNLDGLAYTH